MDMILGIVVSVSIIFYRSWAESRVVGNVTTIKLGVPQSIYYLKSSRGHIIASSCMWILTVYCCSSTYTALSWLSDTIIAMKDK